MQGGRYETVCSGCSECQGTCNLTEKNAPVCKQAIDHTTSKGGGVTLATLVMDPGYWRTNNRSRNVLECYHEDACKEAPTGTAGNCDTGYEGPCECLLLLFSAGCLRYPKHNDSWREMLSVYREFAKSTPIIRYTPDGRPVLGDNNHQHDLVLPFFFFSGKMRAAVLSLIAVNDVYEDTVLHALSPQSNHSACLNHPVLCCARADCAVCSDGYAESLAFRCSKCSRSRQIVFGAVVIPLVVIIVVVLVLFLVSKESGRADQGQDCLDRFKERVPLNSAKIVIVSWQILASVRPTAV